VKNPTATEIRALLIGNQEEIRQRFGVRVVGIFGSYARGEAAPISDVDLLLELERPVGLEIVDVKEYLEALLGLPVDVVTLGALRKKPLLQESIEEDLVRV